MSVADTVAVGVLCQPLRLTRGRTCGGRTCGTASTRPVAGDWNGDGIETGIALEVRAKKLRQKTLL